MDIDDAFVLVHGRHAELAAQHLQRDSSMSPWPQKCSWPETSRVEGIIGPNIFKFI